MSSSPKYKVFNAVGEYVACCKHVEDAAAIIASYGDGASIRTGHAKKDTVYVNGVDGNAGDSYDAVARHVYGPTCYQVNLSQLVRAVTKG